MRHWWVADVILTASAWWASQRLMQSRRSAAFLAAVCFALLGLASWVYCMVQVLAFPDDRKTR
ncbi:hypothetical protein [Saccharospirillum sp.]|uniref:hypothetical protein n=1 Tax=Saccharospirillum sp. TaxID=2033801 RepID=UPI0034A017D5